MIIRQNNYLSVPAHARLTYDLRGNELLAYGLIHGFSQDGTSWYEGGQQYIADWCGISKRGVREVLNRLISLGAIERKEIVINNVTFCKYRVILTEEESSAGVGKKVPQGAKESSCNNISSIINDNIVIEDNSSRIINNTSKNISSSIKEKRKKEIDLSFVGSSFIDTMERYISYRKELKKPLVQSSAESAYRNLLKLSNQDARIADEIVEQSISNGWTGLFELKQTTQYGSNNNQTSRNPWCDAADAITAAGGIL